jgi:hypothetical protein
MSRTPKYTPESVATQICDEVNARADVNRPVSFSQLALIETAATKILREVWPTRKPRTAKPKAVAS